MVDRVFRHMATYRHQLVKQSQWVLSGLEHAFRTLARRDMGCIRDRQRRAFPVDYWLGKPHPNERTTQLRPCSSLPRQTHCVDPTLALAARCHHAVARRTPMLRKGLLREPHHAESWSIGLACHYRKQVSARSGIWSMDCGSHARRLRGAKRVMHWFGSNPNSIDARPLAHYARLVALGALLIGGPNVACQGLNRTAFVQACLARAQEARRLDAPSLDSLELWIYETLDHPIPFPSWPRDQLESIPCLRPFDAFRLGGYLAQLGNPKDPLEWYAMGLDSLAIVGMNELFVLSASRPSTPSPDWFHLYLRQGRWRLRGRHQQVHWGPSIRWTGWLTIIPHEGWDWQQGIVKWTYRVDHGHDLTWQLNQGNFGIQVHPDGMLWHTDYRNDHWSVTTWGDLNLIHGFHLTAALPYGVLCQYGQTRQLTPWRKSASTWRRYLQDGIAVHIPYWGGTLAFRHHMDFSGIYWHNRYGSIRALTHASHRAVSIRHRHHELDWTFILGDAQGASIATHSRYRHFAFQSELGWLTGSTEGMWFGDPLTMRSPGWHQQLRIKSSTGKLQWQARISYRPSGWAFGVDARYTISATRTKT